MMSVLVTVGAQQPESGSGAIQSRSAIVPMLTPLDVPRCRCRPPPRRRDTRVELSITNGLDHNWKLDAD
jgi:hypothetical protein